MKIAYCKDPGCRAVIAWSNNDSQDLRGGWHNAEDGSRHGDSGTVVVAGHSTPETTHEEVAALLDKALAQ